MKFLGYAVLRLGVFALVFFAALWIYPNVFIALIAGLIVSFGVGYLLTPKLRNEAGRQMGGAFSRDSSSKMDKHAFDDADAEDAYTAGRFRDASDQVVDGEVVADESDAEYDGVEAGADDAGVEEPVETNEPK